MGITFPSKSNMSLSLIAGVIVFGLCQAAPGGGDNLEFSDLPEDEFCKQKTGMHMNFSTGVLPPLPEQRVDEASEIYFNQLRYSRSSVPDSYNALSDGLVSPIKQQGRCGSCAAFASMSSIETCFKKVTGVFGDYSEQQMVDCGFDINGANGCVSAPNHAYLKWASDKKVKFASETQYPYKDMLSTCPSNLPVYDQGARVTGYFSTYDGNEEMLKRMVYEHGSVVVGIASVPYMKDYSGGIFAGCPPAGYTIDHTVSVIGYGTEDGVDYWLIKNSWGRCWGEKGFGKIKRGVGMCGIGKQLASISCGPSA